MKLTIIGGGPGGYVAAIRAAQLGAEVTLVEKKTMGGTCLNVGCIPTKALLHSAERYYEMKYGAEKEGILVSGVKADFAAMQKRKNAVVRQLSGGVSGLMKANRITVVKGTARLKAGTTVEVTGEDTVEELTADKVLIASGSVPSAVPVAGHDLPGVVDSTGALDFEEIPESLCVIGGGVIGVEMAHLYQRLGTKVTIVELLPDILFNLDADITSVIKRQFKRNKTEILLETKVEHIEQSGQDLMVYTTDQAGQKKTIAAEKVLLCAGRRPAVTELGLYEIGVHTAKDRIIVDENFQTSVENVYAIGDCIGGTMLAHVASAEGIAAVEKMMGIESQIDFNTIPSCIYTQPELSSVGLTEKEAKDRGLACQVGIFPLTGNGKALIEGAVGGLVKIIADQQSGQILGVHMCGPSATELITAAALAIHKKAAVEDLLATIHAHPSVGESLQEAAHAVFGNALHMPPVKR